MYLHLGGEIVVRASDIIGIFDIETSSISKTTREFLKNAEQQLMVTNVSVDLPKSFVVCNDGTQTRVYISQISTATLKKRLNFLDNVKI